MGTDTMTDKKHLVLVDGSTIAQRDRKLTNKQSGFIQSLMSRDSDGKPLSLSDAYRANYDTRNKSAKTVNEKASLLASQDKIRARLSALRQQQDDNSLRVADKRIDFVVERLTLEALGRGEDSNPASRVRALELIAKLSLEGGSLFQERIAIDDQRDADSIRQELEAKLATLLAGKTPE